MDTLTATEYDAALHPLSTLIEAATADSWTNPSPCEGWTALDVLEHLVSTQRDFLTGRGIDLGAQPPVGVDPAAAWRGHAERVREVLADDAVVTAAYDSHFGPSTVGATFTRFYVWDMVVHRWDLARAVGAQARLTDAELDLVEAGADAFGEALHLDGVCRPAVEAPADADRQTRVLARLGRTR
jgi:uncharacterized protein (TIGR03086 family)